MNPSHSLLSYLPAVRRADRKSPQPSALSPSLFALCLALTLPINSSPAQPTSPDNLKAAFANPPIELRPRPLWFWNNTPVRPDEIRHQMQQAKSLSLYGGFGILPFGHHFAPAYLSDDYFTAYGTALDEARKLGMTLSLYDEYGFPSGSAGAQNSSPTSLFAQRYPHLTIHRLDKHEWPLTPSQPNTITLPAGQLTALVALNTISLQRIELSDQITANTLT